MKRLRVVDWNTPWFWLTVFKYPRQARHGSAYFEIQLWNPNTWQRWWLNVWQWEEHDPTPLGMIHGGASAVGEVRKTEK